MCARYNTCYVQVGIEIKPTHISVSIQHNKLGAIFFEEICYYVIDC